MKKHLNYTTTMRSQLGMKPMKPLQKKMMILVLILLWFPASMGAEKPCTTTPNCICKWSAGKYTAECVNKGLTSIPESLKNEAQSVQNLILNQNNIGKLEKDAFKSAGLLNLQKIELRSCHLEEIHEHAFRDLKILIDVDISANNLTKLQPKTFDGNNNLQIIKAAQNPLRELMPYQFPPLKNLKMLDFSHCELQTIDKMAFHNLGQSMETIYLNNNQLRNVQQGALSTLHSLKTLQLHVNPWLCDCRLKAFRDYVVNRNLYKPPTTCHEPARLNKKHWNKIETMDFACKPIITIPREFVFSSPGRNATLSCLIEGSPLPTLRWVKNGRIINNMTSPVAFSNQIYIIHQETYHIQKWYNLTITNSGYDNLGEYVCVADNNGGVQEKGVTLTFDNPQNHFSTGGWGLTPEKWTIVIGAVTASLVFIALMVALVCCCCFCKKAKKAKTSEANKAKTAISAYGEQDQSHQRLLPPQQHCEINSSIGNVHGGGSIGPHQHHGYHHQYGGQHAGDITELTELRTPSVLSKPHSTTDSSHSRHSIADNSYDPDLINHHRKTSTPLSVQTLMGPRHSPHAGQPIMVNGGSSTPISGGHQHHRVSPFTRSGTLPMNYQHHPHHPRSVSCDHTGSGAQTLRLTPNGQQQQTHQKPKHSLQHHPQAVIAQQQARPGYVTLPRRPRSSWSVPPRDSPSPSVTSSGGNNNALYVTMQRPRREPIYDGVGPRTSADGSSMSTLPRGASMAGSGMTSPAASIISHQKYSLGPYYAPIAELQECPTTANSTANSSTKKGSEDSSRGTTPVSSNGDNNKNHSAGNSNNKNFGREFSSSSEMTLMEESISSYMEPFGKALAPPLGVSSGAESTPTPSSSKSRHSTTSAESELEALIVIQNGKNHQHSPKEHKLEEDIPPMMPLLPPILTPTTVSGVPGIGSNTNGHGMSETSTAFNGGGHGENNTTATNGNSANLNGNNSSKKVPPKTLPKPKVRPLPPPKPSKSSMLKKPVVFQDEGADGSEV